MIPVILNNSKSQKKNTYSPQIHCIYALASFQNKQTKTNAHDYHYQLHRASPPLQHSHWRNQAWKESSTQVQKQDHPTQEQDN